MLPGAKCKDGNKDKKGDARAMASLITEVVGCKNIIETHTAFLPLCHYGGNVHGAPLCLLLSDDGELRFLILNLHRSAILIYC